jgi:hypothetical protein
MGTKANVNDVKQEPHGKYEIIIWKGPVSAAQLMKLGVAVPEDKEADDIEAEVWMIDNTVIKADMNAWRMMGCDVKTVHTFVFDEDDTSPIGNGLPNVLRDSQMSICNAVRMALDNASVVCGPMLEMNVALLRPGQDTKPIQAYQTFERDDDGLTAQFPAIREIKVDAHTSTSLSSWSRCSCVRRHGDVRRPGDRRRHREDAVGADAHRGRRSR